jgi:hypothetical protein
MGRSSLGSCLFCAIVLTAPIPCSCMANGAEVLPIATTVCEITTHPRLYQGKLVSFQAQFQSDGIEHSVLVDPWCKHGLGPQWNGSPKGEEAFDKALYTGYRGTLDKTITATWIGRFAWHPGQRPTWVLNVVEIRDLKLDYIPPAPDAPPPAVHLPDPPLPVWPPK